MGLELCFCLVGFCWCWVVGRVVGVVENWFGVEGLSGVVDFVLFSVVVKYRGVVFWRINWSVKSWGDGDFGDEEELVEKEEWRVVVGVYIVCDVLFFFFCYFGVLYFGLDYVMLGVGVYVLCLIVMF